MNRLEQPMNKPSLDKTPRRSAKRADASWPGAVAPDAMAVTFVATVLSGNALNGWRLDAGAQPCHGVRAASCLIEPDVGDRVACWRVAEGDAGQAAVFVVAVLSRAAVESPARLSVAGDLEIAPIAGRLSLRSEQGVSVEAPRCEVRTEALALQAQSASLVARVVETIGETCAATFGQLRLVGGLLATVFDRETHHAQSHSRQVDGIDRLDAHVVDHNARDVLHLQGENVLANGDKLVKVRGTQIHFG
jgi:hypothetical protein